VSEPAHWLSIAYHPHTLSRIQTNDLARIQVARCDFRKSRYSWSLSSQLTQFLHIFRYDLPGGAVFVAPTMAAKASSRLVRGGLGGPRRSIPMQRVGLPALSSESNAPSPPLTLAEATAQAEWQTVG
jgi:hypothetical protein